MAEEEEVKIDDFVSRVSREGFTVDDVTPFLPSVDYKFSDEGELDGYEVKFNQGYYFNRTSETQVQTRDDQKISNMGDPFDLPVKHDIEYYVEVIVNAENFLVTSATFTGVSGDDGSDITTQFPHILFDGDNVTEFTGYFPILKLKDGSLEEYTQRSNIQLSDRQFRQLGGSVAGLAARPLVEDGHTSESNPVKVRNIVAGTGVTVEETATSIIINATGTGEAGGTGSCINIGSAVEVYNEGPPKSSNPFEFRTLTGEGNTDVLIDPNNGSQILISGGLAENMPSASHPIYVEDENKPFLFKGLAEGNGISLSSDAQNVTISASGAATGSCANTGDGIDVYVEGSSNPFIFRSLQYQLPSNKNNVSVNQIGDNNEMILISGGIADNIGAGAQVYYQDSIRPFEFKTLTGAENITITDQGNMLEIKSEDQNCASEGSADWFAYVDGTKNPAKFRGLSFGDGIDASSDGCVTTLSVDTGCCDLDDTLSVGSSSPRTLGAGGATFGSNYYALTPAANNLHVEGKMGIGVNPTEMSSYSDKVVICGSMRVKDGSDNTQGDLYMGNSTSPAIKKETEKVTFGADIQVVDFTYPQSISINPQGATSISHQTDLGGYEINYQSPATGSAILGGSGNAISGNYNVIIAGINNQISGGNTNVIGGGSGINVDSSEFSVSVGGRNNDVSGSNFAVIGGGFNNLISGSERASIAGGSANKIKDAFAASIGGGQGNLVANKASAIAGGESNTIKEKLVGGGYNFIGAGVSNTISGSESTIVGGNNNIISGSRSITLGGTQQVIGANDAVTAGNYSIVQPSHNGAFVFSDSVTSPALSSGANTMLLSFKSGVFIDTDSGIYINGNPVMTGVSDLDIDTLQTVTERGATSNQAISVSNVVTANEFNVGNEGKVKSTSTLGLQLLSSTNKDIIFAPNNGSTERMRIKADGDVGIGTTDPSEKLEVSGNILVTGAGSAGPHLKLAGTYTTWEIENQYAGGASNDMFRIRNTALADDALVINRGNNKVGIGTTNPTSKLHIEENGGRVRIGSPTTSYGGIGFAASLTTANAALWGTATTTIIGAASAGSIEMKLGNDAAGNGSLKMEVDKLHYTAGLVGIGTTTPDTRLHVVSNNNVAKLESTSADARLRLKAPNLNKSSIIFDKSGTSAVGAIRYDNNNNKLSFDVNSDERVTINSSGDVGIGTTVPSRQLEVSDSGATVAIKVSATDGSQSSLDLLNTEGSFRLINDGGTFSIYDDGDSEERIRINTTGNVGIGTNNPSQLLHVFSSTTNPTGIGLQNSQRYYSVRSNNFSLVFTDETVAEERMRISSSGHVGIGTTSPASTLEIEAPSSANGTELKITSAFGESPKILSFDYVLSNTNTTAAQIIGFGRPSFGPYMQFKVHTGSTLSEVMRLTSSGHVGIGTTNPSAALTIKGSANDSTFRLNSFLGSGYIDALMGNTPYFRLYQSNGNRLQIGAGDGNINRSNSSNAAIDLSFATNGGNVGIGTTSPSRPLHVLFSGDSGTRIESTDSHSSLYIESHSGKGQYIRFSENTADKYWINSSGGKLYFRPAATGTAANQVIFDSSGNVGIGTTGPSEKLEVIGNGKLSGTLTITNDMVINSSGNRSITWGANDLSFKSGTTTGLRVNAAEVRVNTKFGLHNAGGLTNNTELLGMELEGSQSSHYSHAIFAVPQANHIPTNLYIRGEDGAYGGGSTKGVSVYIHGGDNTTSTNQGDVILAHDGSSGRGNVGIGTTSPSAKLELAGTYGNTKLDGHFIGFTRASANYLWANATGGDLRFTVNGNAIGSPSMIINTSGNVGIGTTNPSDELEVYKNGSDVAIRIHEDAGTHEAKLHLRRGGNDWEIINNSDLAFEIEGSEIARFKTNGNVGIGTTIPVARLDVSTTGADGINLSQDTAASTISSRLFFSNATAGQGVSIYNSGSNMRFQTGSTIGSSTGTTRMVINSSGNVGIGTVSPNALLELSKDGGGSSTTLLNVGGTGNGRMLVRHIDGKLHSSDATDSLYLNYVSSGHISMVNGGGSVGIGSNAPSAKLDVAGAGKFTGQVTIPATPSASTDAASKGYVDSQVGSADTLQEVTDNGNTTTNSVGIGTTSVAGAKLEIQTTAGSPMLQLRPTGASTDINPLILYRNQNNGTANYLLAKNASTYFGTYNSGVPTDESEMVKITPSTSDAPILQIGDAGSTAARLDVGGNIRLLNNGYSYISGGDVGIGTTSPQTRLDVNSSTINKVATFTSTDSTAFIQIADQNTTATTHGYGANGNVLSLYANDEERMRIHSDGNVSIGSNSASAKLTVLTDATSSEMRTVNISHTRNDPDVATQAVRIDMNLSGADNTTDDRLNSGLILDIDSSANGDASNEHKIYGVHSDVRFTGFSDIVRGGYFLAESNYTGAKTSQLIGVYGQAIHDAASTSGGVSNMYGVYGYSNVQDLGDVDNSFGGKFLVLISSGRGDADVGVTKGVEGEVTIDKASTINYGTMIGVSSIIDNNEGSVPNFGNQYLFKGAYEGTKGANAYGIYVGGDKNYFEGSVGIGTTNPSTIFHIDDDASTGTGLLLTGGGLGQALATFTRDVGGSGTIAINSSDSRPQIKLAASSNTFALGVNGSTFEIADNDKLGTNPRLSITNTGNVGIGTTGPNALLNVQGDSDPTILINAVTGNSANSGKLAFAETDGGAHQAWMKYDGSANRLEIGTAEVSQALVIKRTDGNVGIGTTNPANLLSVVDSGGTGLEFIPQDANNRNVIFSYKRSASAYKQLNFSANDYVFVTGGVNDRMVIKNDGKVGIGTTSPNHTLDVETATDDIVASFNSLDNKAAIGIYDDDTQIYLSAADSKGSFGFQVGTHANNLNIDASGNVGIGTTNPSGKLEIKASSFAGTIRFRQPDGNAPFVSSTAGTAMVFQTYTGTDKAAIYVDNSGNFTIGGANIHLDGVVSGDRFKALNGGALTSPSIQLDDTTGDESGLYLPATNNIGIITDRLERVRIDGSGNVGIGTNSPSANGSKTTLHINSDTNGAAIRLSQASNSSLIRYDNTNGLKVGTIASKNLSFETADTTAITIDTNQNVGIGTTSPRGKLDIVGNTDDDTDFLTIQDNDPTAGSHRPSIRFRSDTAQIGQIASLDNGMRFSVGTSEDSLLEIKSGGYVGIGTTNPCSKLEVNGHFAATSKSFIIDHPTQKDKKLQYASLEGPENGVYVRGTTDKETIDLPEYWSELVHEDSITVVLTPIGKKQDLFIKEKSNKLIKIGGAEGSFDYVVYGERKDIDKLEIEPLKV
jgi:hypothetical protein